MGRKRLFFIGWILTLAYVLVSGADLAAQPLTVYSGRSEELVGPIIEQFRAATDINVRVRYGGTAELAATLLEEDSRTPADVFFAQDPGGLGAVIHLLAPIPEAVLEPVDRRFRSRESRWVGISGRARVVVYNRERLRDADLPDNMWGFTAPEWRNRIGWPPTNGSFQAMVTAMRILWGDERTRQWLRAIQANEPKVYPKNTPIVAAAGAGEVDVGFVNHYYLLRFLQERGEAFPARNYHPRGGGPGALILVAGAGILETSQHRDAATRFLRFMLSPVAQHYFASRTFEYPVVRGVNTSRFLVPLDAIRSPEIDLADLSDLRGTLRILRETGVLP